MLPAGFKVNGTEVTEYSIPPKIVKITSYLDNLPFGELLTSIELAARVRVSRTGDSFNHPALSEYREKQNCLYWGSKATIADLRKKLTEDVHD